MSLHFSKYQGTGNDFILIDNRDFDFDGSDLSTIKFLCDRKMGIGADGLMLLESHPTLDFKMRYFNSDGKEGSMCGNGGRCIVAFAKKLGIILKTARFEAIDGVHEAIICKNNIVDLLMQDVNNVEQGDDFYFLDTGSPHYVTFKDDVKGIDIVREGRCIRNNDRFKEIGTNVNFAQIESDKIIVYTYERGVEDETLSCGTGVTAAAISAALKARSSDNSYNIETKGGKLKVKFNKLDDNHFNNIWLEGDVTFVFDGYIEI